LGDLHQRGNLALHGYELLAQYKVAYLDCQQGESKTTARSVAIEQGIDCADQEWGDLVKRGQRLKLRKVVPLVRKIRAEQNAKKRTQAARDIKRLKADLAAEAKSLKSYLKDVEACG